MIWPILLRLARVLGPFLPFLATWVAAKRDARLKASNDALEADIKAMKDRERIDNDVADETDLVSRAAKSGVLRKPGK